MNLVIIDYGSGNLRSVAKAFEHVGASVIVTSESNALKNASHIVLPGVGAFGDCMSGLQSLPGMFAALKEEVKGKGKLFLGICVGMQMMFERGFEHGEHQGLGWLAGDVVALKPSADAPKIPHMGWNNLSIEKSSHPLMRGIDEGAHAYFVHSYHATALKEDRIAKTHYGQDIAAVVGRDNMMGTQFHPEKSQSTGLAILRNFMAI